jgi:serine-type D-Ala-D-Ala carboxypeptidase/endopeptidase (penicillin-binding protein 4)
LTIQTPVMKKSFSFSICCFLLCMLAHAQVNKKLAAAWKQFESDLQMENAVGSLYVINAKTGAVVFSKNANTGLAPASTQKIVTAATAFELLGKD